MVPYHTLHYCQAQHGSIQLQFNFAEFALIQSFSNPTHAGKVLRGKFEFSYYPNLKVRFMGPFLTDDKCPSTRAKIEVF